MPFTIFCDNKGCGKYQDPLLDVETNDVHCTECGNVIKGVTSFAKNQMKSMGQIKRSKQGQTAFSVECHNCKKSTQPKLVDNKLVCFFCNEEHKLSAPYAYAIKQFLGAKPGFNKK